ncbi:MAG: DMT family transporter [Adlercreutzia mucosicola]|jgi:drug/metabolite transporter (DMT)-like permease|uniref:EamA family transporter n=1 Tax=Adlercreutzia mucosicola TaxID=580026 RepID=A0A6N8JNG0_9ACTN|nr:DMT family transporter [Adlercreutzia mucosicola]MCI9494326.1 DMT family transporter [Adlercreutzia mucosicola]MVX61411.1 EamA family transporter [Adlercreutzia mucosicola]
MKYGLMSGCLWGLDTVILGIALTMVPFIGTAEAIALGAIVSSALHDVFCALWLLLYMGVRGRLKDTLAALKTRSGKVVMLGALLGGPLGMTGYVIAINNIGAGYTAIISSFYPAFGTLMAVLLLKEKITAGRLIALFVALGGIIAMGYLSADTTVVGDPTIGLIAAIVTVVGWGSEAVLCAWGMRDDAVDNETALQIRETTSAIVYLFVILPIFGAWMFTWTSLPTFGVGVVALAALAGTASYLFYYKGIATIGAAKGMALNISYSAWAVLFGLILLGSVPGPVEIICCVAILCGTILAACDWKELFSRGKGQA